MDHVATSDEALGTVDGDTRSGTESHAPRWWLLIAMSMAAAGWRVAAASLDPSAAGSGTAGVAIVAGVVFAWVGGDAFLDGSVMASRRLRISMAVIGVTVAAFATSAPELAVAVTAALAGTPGIALGDGVGTSVVNLAVVLGIALCFGAVPARRSAVRAPLLVGLAAPLLVAMFAIGGVFSRFEGLALYVLMAFWTAKVVRDALHERDAGDDAPVPEARLRGPALRMLAGIWLLAAAGSAIVFGARTLGALFGLADVVVGATLVALGTSTPELAITLMSLLRGQRDLGVATLLGSNIFNIFVIVATAAVIRPIPVEPWTLVPVLVAFAFATAASWPTRDDIIPRWRGFALLTLYSVYVGIVILR